jgi:hypothetical protein
LLFTSGSIFSGDKFEKNEMEWACSANGREERRSQRFGWGNRLEEAGIDGRKILRWIFRKWDVVVWLRIETGAGDL